MTKRYVRETDGGWAVLAEGQRRTTVVSDTRNQAVARARAIVRDAGGGEIRVVNRVGKVIALDKVSRASKVGARQASAAR